jgi:hypothetical protein
MPSIELTDNEFNNLVFVLANAEFRNGVTWNTIAPLIAAAQRAAPAPQAPQAPPAATGKQARPARSPNGNKEMESIP